MDNTIDAFWSMVWANDVTEIFCLTKTQENGKVHATVYWKSTEPQSMNEFKVTIKNKTDDGFAVLREIELENIFKKEKKTIMHYHIENWEDDKVPILYEHIDLLEKMVQSCSKQLDQS